MGLQGCGNPKPEKLPRDLASAVENRDKPPDGKAGVGSGAPGLEGGYRLEGFGVSGFRSFGV